MSGGTDSSVAALLLIEQGYEVIGVTFRFKDMETDAHVSDAVEVAKKIGIEHFVVDATKVFNRTVISYFVDEYLSGRTPFPCAKCNNELKWNLIIEEADRLGCSKVAMGHYAQIVRDGDFYFFKEGVDPDKDQTFFLWGLRQDQISRIVFPLGQYFKKDIRAIALQKGFEYISKKKDSLGACFCNGDYRPFLKSLLSNPDEWIFPGNFIDEEGKVLGQHQGYPMYTVGQRRGLMHLNRKVFVKQINPDRNEVMLAPLSSLYKTEIYLKEVNVVNKQLFTEKFDIYTRIRYRKQNTLSRVVLLENNTAKIELAEPLESIAPGQTAVFYRDGKVLGGGFIC